ncbi:centromere protein J isoform X2 [Ceratina calcarata]|uniref:Centromere protein J isoform X2 n=1 Tax=Ceratina calcarata TaxID=156304 RepID=A0AAJ7WF00_9HYME|nr:centromere protein J isoform X2 [Ceratina calcarata]
MNLEASIVERLQKLRQWQLEQQERLLKQQQIQREMLSQKQDCMFKALELSIQELDSQDASSTSNLNSTVGDGELDNKNLITQSQTSEDCARALNNSELVDNQDINNILQGITSQQQSPENKLMENSITNRTEQRYLNDKEICDTKGNIKIIITTPEEKPQMEQFQMDGVAPLTPDKSLAKRLCIDDVPIPSPRKDFHTLLEERLKDSENEFSGRCNVKEHIEKKPFLRKGEGLSRFKLNKNISSPNTKELSRSLTNTQFKCSSNDKRANKNIQHSKAAQLPKNMRVKKTLSLKNVPLPKKKARNESESKSTPHLEDCVHESKESIESNTVEFQSGTQKELEEVRIFELMEEKAENSSFCSTSSAVIAFLQQSTPFKIKKYGHKAESMGIEKQLSPAVKDKTATKSDQAHTNTTPSKNTDTYSNLLPFIRENLSELYKNMFMQSASEIKMSELNGSRDALLNTQIQPVHNQQNLYNVPTNANSNEADVSLHVRFSECNQYKTIGLTDTSTISTDSVMTKRFQDDKVWSDSSSPDTSMMETPPEYDSTIENNDFMCNAEISQYVYDKEELNLLNTLATTPKNNIHSIKSSNMEKCDNDNDDVVVIGDEENQKNLEETNETIFKSELLKYRLVELEKEIDIFRKENIALSMQRKQLQEDYRTLYKEFSEKEKNFEEHRKQMDDRWHEEKKKLAREKASLENRMSDLQKKVQQHRLERQELQCLRDAMERLAQEVHAKETKRNAMEYRHKCQMRILKAENLRLKDEVEKLQTLLKSKVKNVEKPETANTRAIHQINRVCNLQLKRIPRINSSSSDGGEKLKPMKTLSTANEKNADAGKEQHSDNSKNVNERPRRSQLSRADVIKKGNLYKQLIEEITSRMAETKESSAPLENSELENIPKSASELRVLTDTTNTMKSNCETSESLKANTQMHQENDEKKSVLASEEPNSNIENVPPNHEVEEPIKQVVHPDGSVEAIYLRGNVKRIFPDQGLIRYTYHNGDIHELNKNGVEKYFYASAGTWQTKTVDGLEILEFADGQIERRTADGKVEVLFPDGAYKISESDGFQKWTMPNGLYVEIFPSGEKFVIWPNGQREIHTKTYKKREYPDGTIKLLYQDGTQKTQYSSGRIRIRDKDGNLLTDSYESDIESSMPRSKE